MNLVTIGKRSERRPSAFYCADLFFTIGMIGAISGSLAGIIIWFSLAGVTEPSTYFGRLRDLHTFVQFFLLLGAFICGFLLQASPTFMNVKLVPGRIPSIIAAYAFVAGAMGITLGITFVAKLGAALSFIATLIAILPLINNSLLDTKVRLGIPYTAGLLALTTCALIFDGTPLAGVTTFWAGVAPIIFATAQRFITGTFGSPPFSIKFLILLYVAHSISALSLIFSLIFGMQISWPFISTCACIVICGYIIASGLAVGVKQVIRQRDPFLIALPCAFAWALAGSVLLWSPDKGDAALHAWGIGWAFTLIITVSSRVVRTVTLYETVPDTLPWWLLIGWQVFVFTRVFYRMLPLPVSIYWLSGGIGIAIILIWLGGLCRAIKGILSAKKLKLAGYQSQAMPNRTK